MPDLMLFCVADEAKPFIRKILAYSDYAKGVPDPWYLVESKTNPKDPSMFKKKVETDNEPIKSEFIGATPQECQEWLLREQDQVTFMEKDILFIADARSARDETLLAQVYRREQIVYGVDDENGKKLPPTPYTWWNYRIKFEEAWDLHSMLNYGPASAVDPFVYERKEEAVDGEGVFSVQKAEELIFHS
ncbi:unnamed protein product [Periconia digitata]|uniref:Uncharacterized protein n=1 Tax=Periconia digitata TaxID=1303443 RepID=A0A9W4XEZ4_9PLEO|nr:unnamed protein product [Periconia digitata]